MSMWGSLDLNIMLTFPHVLQLGGGAFGVSRHAPPGCPCCPQLCHSQCRPPRGVLGQCCVWGCLCGVGLGVCPEW